MKVALLLIALGFGYKIYAEACQNRSKKVRRLGQIISSIIMIFSLVGVLCVTLLGGRYGACPSCGSKGWKSGWSCPFAAKKNLPYFNMKALPGQ